MESLYQEYLFKLKKLCDQIQAAGGNAEPVIERFIQFDETGSLFWRLLMQLNVNKAKQEPLTALLDLLATQKFRLPLFVAKLLFDYKLYLNVAPDPAPAKQRVIDHCTLLHMMQETLQYECQRQTYSISQDPNKDLLRWRDQQGEVALLTYQEVEEKLHKRWFSQATKSLKKQPPQPELTASKFIIEQASPEAGLGLRVIEPIAQDEFLFFYGGVYQKRGKSVGWRYSLHDFNRRKCICADQAINFGGLMLHLPMREDLDKTGFAAKGLAKDQVATENVTTGLVLLGERDYQVGVFAMRSLQVGEHIGFDYGLDHWAVEGVSPQLFTRTGEVVDGARFSNPTGIRKVRRGWRTEYLIVSEPAKKAYLEEHEAKTWPELMFFIDQSGA